jgi:hypothetical protein
MQVGQGGPKAYYESGVTTGKLIDNEGVDHPKHYNTHPHRH